LALCASSPHHAIQSRVMVLARRRVLREKTRTKMTFNENSEPAEVFLKTKTIKKDKNVKKTNNVEKRAKKNIEQLAQKIGFAMFCS
jgi:hypothetical protein